MDKKFILDLAINTTSPRNNKEFLWVSYSINNLNSVKYGKSYWMTLEKRCLSLFSDSGYDLQTGVWFCLISAHLYGWEGLAISSWKFADTFVTQKNVGLLLHQLRHEEIFWSGILKMLFLSFRPRLMMKGLIPH